MKNLINFLLASLNWASVLITLIKLITLIIFAINFNKKFASYSWLKSIMKKVTKTQGLNQY